MGEAIIVGAGIGGLTAALALQRAGVGVRVLERAERLVPAGAGLTIQPNAVMALRRLGIGSTFETKAQPLSTAQILTAQGKLLQGLDQAAATKLRNDVGAPAYGIHRATLQAILLGALEPDTVELSTAVADVDAAAGRVTLADGGQREAAIVIGADGLNSIIRTRLVGDGLPRYSGYYCWRGVTRAAPFPPDWSGEFWGRGTRFGGCGIDGGWFYWFAVADGPAGGRDPEGARTAAMDAVQGFDERVVESVATTAPDDVFRTDISDRDPVTSWGVERATLLGDAAHPMTPNLGQGACQAIEDALVLGDRVARLGAEPAALRAYEDARIKRANTTVRAARRLGDVAQASTRTGSWLRNRGAALLPQGALLRQLTTAWSLPADY